MRESVRAELKKDQTRYARSLCEISQRGDNDNVEVTASLSSETPVDRGLGPEQWREILMHGPENVDVSRGPLPLLWGHDSDDLIGNVHNVRVEDKKLKGELVFSRNERGQSLFRDVVDKVARWISIGYQIDYDSVDDRGDEVIINKWRVLEASLVSIPADATVGPYRELTTGDMTMGDDKVTGKDNRTDAQEFVVQFDSTRRKNLESGKETGAKEERKRVLDIYEAFDKAQFRGDAYDDLKNACIENGVSVERARELLLEMIGAGYVDATVDLVSNARNEIPEQKIIATPSGVRKPSGQVEVREDAYDKFTRAISDTLADRCGALENAKKAEVRASEFRGMTIGEMAREYLNRVNFRAAGLTKTQVIGKALITRGLMGHSTSDFAQILEDTANKSLQMGYNETEETYRGWCRIGSVSDFRIASRPQMSAFGELEEVKESGEYTQGTVSDYKETIQVVRYGKLFSISAQALVNDDLDALSRIPQSMGRAAARKVGDLAYSILTNGESATMTQDGVALFAAGHSNYVASGDGGGPTVATVNAARTAMAKQTSNGATLNIRPAYLICPVALEGTALALARSEFNPAVASGVEVNTVAGTFQVISDARLDASPAKWFMAASPGSVDTVEVAFLDGIDTPYLDSQDGWSIDGIEYKVRIDAGASALDFRGLYCNFGS